jgi:hypothetical protein
VAVDDDATRYKVVRLLDELMPVAATPQNSGVSFDIRLYLREDSNDGHLWAEVAFLDRSNGKLLNDVENSLPLDRPEVVGWYFDEIAKRGFEMVPRLRKTPMRGTKKP